MAGAEDEEATTLSASKKRACAEALAAAKRRALEEAKRAALARISTGDDNEKPEDGGGSTSVGSALSSTASPSQNEAPVGDRNVLAYLQQKSHGAMGQFLSAKAQNDAKKQATFKGAPIAASAVISSKPVMQTRAPTQELPFGGNKKRGPNDTRNHLTYRLENDGSKTLVTNGPVKCATKSIGGWAMGGHEGGVMFDVARQKQAWMAKAAPAPWKPEGAVVEEKPGPWAADGGKSEEVPSGFVQPGKLAPTGFAAEMPTWAPMTANLAPDYQAPPAKAMSKAGQMLQKVSPLMSARAATALGQAARSAAIATQRALDETLMGSTPAWSEEQEAMVDGTSFAGVAPVEGGFSFDNDAPDETPDWMRATRPAPQQWASASATFGQVPQQWGGWGAPGAGSFS